MQVLARPFSKLHFLSMSDPTSFATETSKQGRWGCIVMLVIIGAISAWWWQRPIPETPEVQRMGRRGGGGGGGFGLPTPVTVEEIKTEDFAEWVSLAGTVTPLNVVTVRSRVDGELQKVTFKEGQLVKAGDLIAEIDPRPFQVQYDQAKGQLARDEALRDNAQADLKRYETLLRQDSIAKQQVDTQASLVRQYEAALASDQAAIASADLQLSYTKIHAPISGRAGLRQIDAGNMIHPGDANGLVIITQMDPIGLVSSIPQERVIAVRKALESAPPVAVVAVDKEMNRTLATGHLVTTDNQIDLTSGTLKLKAELPNADGALFPNQFVVARLLVGTQKNAIVAPATAIQRGSKGAYAYVLQADGKSVALRNLTTGNTQADKVLITEGLAVGEKVVTQGVDRLRDAAKVEVIPQPGVGAAGSNK
jgi:multidrug efflux system membrane fusion protein